METRALRIGFRMKENEHALSAPGNPEEQGGKRRQSRRKRCGEVLPLHTSQNQHHRRYSRQHQGRAKVRLLHDQIGRAGRQAAAKPPQTLRRGTSTPYQPEPTSSPLLPPTPRPCQGQAASRSDRKSRAASGGKAAANAAARYFHSIPARTNIIAVTPANTKAVPRSGCFTIRSEEQGGKRRQSRRKRCGEVLPLHTSQNQHHRRYSRQHQGRAKVRLLHDQQNEHHRHDGSTQESVFPVAHFIEPGMQKPCQKKNQHRLGYLGRLKSEEAAESNPAVRIVRVTEEKDRKSEERRVG